MDIVVLSKRQYMYKDLLDDRYGRFWEIPAELARLGHNVRGFALSYASKEEGVLGSSSDQLQWESWNAGSIRPLGLLRYRQRVSKALAKSSPDVIWACSDSLYVLVGQQLARQYGAVCVADLYDNFEAYAAVTIPGVRAKYQRALKNVAGISVNSERLKAKVLADTQTTRPVLILNNGIPTGMFGPLDKKSCRREFGLPLEAPMIGSTGIMTHERGFELILEGFRELKKTVPDLRLLLAGPRTSQIHVPAEEGIHDLGDLPQSELPRVLGCMDLAVICNKRTAFSEYTFPQRLYETLACGIPLLASKVGAIQDVLQDYPDCLYAPNDCEDFVRKAQALLKKPVIPDIPVRSWRELTADLEQFMRQLCPED